MLYLIHGDDETAIHNKVKDLVHIGTVPLTLDARKLKSGDIQNTFDSKDLFTSKKTVILEAVSKLMKPDFKLLIDISNLLKKDENTTIILYDTLILKLTFTKQFPDAKVLQFNLPKFFFSFLDSFTPNNSKHLITLRRKLENEVNDELLYYSIIKRIRHLLMLKSKQNFTELSKMQSWQITRLQNQSNEWDFNQLIKVYKKLFELEILLKTSNLPLSLGKHIDLLIVQSLN